MALKFCRILPTWYRQMFTTALARSGFDDEEPASGHEGVEKRSAPAPSPGSQEVCRGVTWSHTLAADARLEWSRGDRESLARGLAMSLMSSGRIGQCASRTRRSYGSASQRGGRRFSRGARTSR